MKINFRAIVFSLVLLAAFASAYGETYYGLELGARNYVRGASAKLYINHESKIWGRKKFSDDWQYGLVQLHGGISAHGELESSLSVYPISFLQIKYQKKWTQRYSDPAHFSCSGIQCYGPINRDAVHVRLGLGYDVLVGALSYTRQWTKTRNTNEPVYDELENILLTQNTDAAVVKSILLAARADLQRNLLIGAVNRTFEYEASQSKNELFGILVGRDLLVQKKLIKVFGLLGSYKSGISDPGLSITVGAQYQWGDSPLALF